MAASPKQGSLQASIQALSSTAVGAWLLARVLRYLDRFALRLSGGRRTLTSMLAGLPVVQVTTTGARTGKPRTSALVPIRDRSNPERFALVASNFGQHHFPAWYFNLKKNPRAVCSVDGQTRNYVANEAGGDEYERFSKYATETYAGYALYRQRAGRRIPIMVMEPEPKP